MKKTDRTPATKKTDLRCESPDTAADDVKRKVKIVKGIGLQLHALKHKARAPRCVCVCVCVWRGVGWRSVCVRARARV